MRKFLLLASLVSLMCTSGNCSADEDSPDPVENTITVDTVALRENAMPELVSGNNLFAFELYLKIAEDRSNFIISPLSISTALAMTYAGARGETGNEMGEVLHFTLPREELCHGFGILARELEGDSTEEEGFHLSMSNALWAQEDHDFVPEYLESISMFNGAAAEKVDFSSDPESCREIINEWVADETDGRITELLPPNVLTSATKLVITDAIYFKASWRFQFETWRTSERPFSLLDGGEVRVQQMRLSEHYPSYFGEAYSAVELPYRGNRFAMLIILPEQGHFSEIESMLSPDFISGVIDSLSDHSLDLGLPKFQVQSDIRLDDILRGLGMESAFGPSADFSGIDGTLYLYIAAVLHSATISVDEYGTIATAATAVILEKMNGEEATEFYIDKPFIYMIRDRRTGTVLFMGRILNPLE